MKKKIFLSPPFVGADERNAVKMAFDSGYIAPCGPQVDEFEKEIAKISGRKYAVAVSSGTSALDLAMAELNIDSSWTVISPSLTFIATVGPAYHRGAKLIFIDSDLSGNIDCKLLEKALIDERKKSKVKKILVIGVDLYGRCCDYDALDFLSKKYNATLVIDAAEAVGAKYTNNDPAGSRGLMAIYSFNGNKIITTSGGGALLTDDEGIARRAKKRSQQSREPFVWYEHKEVGYNYRLSNILAAIGLAQLQKLPKILKKRKYIYDAYSKYCKLLKETQGENHWLSVAILKSKKERDILLKAYEEANIEVRPVWKPLHLQSVFSNVKVYGGKISENLFNKGLCLPSGTGLTNKEIDAIIDLLPSLSGKSLAK